MDSLSVVKLHKKTPFQSLELDRGCSVCGDVWTFNDLAEYLQEDRRNHWIGFADAKGKYRASLGIGYRLDTDSSGAVVKRVKTIDHMVVDASLGDADALLIARHAIHELARQWVKEGQPEKLRCVVHRRDLAWYMLLVDIGFTTACSGEDWIQLELEGYDAG